MSNLLDDLVKILKGERPPSAASTPIRPPTIKSLGDPEEIAQRFGLPFSQDLSEFPYVKEKITPLPYSFAKNRLMLPLNEEEGLFLSP